MTPPLSGDAMFARMEEIGFVFDCRFPMRDDGLDVVIKPMLTDPVKAAEVEAYYANFTGPHADVFAGMLLGYIVEKERKEGGW